VSTVRIATGAPGSRGKPLPAGEVVWEHVTCEAVGEHFALHPSVVGASPGPIRFSGRWTLTHKPTGFELCDADELTELRRAADAYAELPVDWNFVDPSTIKSWPEAVQRRCGEIRALAAMGAL